jgi:hypothetical protein
VGLFESPEGNAAELVPVACDDADIALQVDPRLLTPEHVHDGTLIFNVEGYGRFRLHLREE